MREYIKERILEEARYIVESEATVRQAAKTFRYVTTVCTVDLLEANVFAACLTVASLSTI